MSVLALIPARSGSKGIPGKNFRRIGGKTLVGRAADVARAAGCDAVVVSSDLAVSDPDHSQRSFGEMLKQKAGIAGVCRLRFLQRPAELAADDTPMIAVVQHALQQIPGPSDQIVVLLQPTQPFRRPEHIIHAVNLLQESGADSVVSVVPLPLTHSPRFQLVLVDQPYTVACRKGTGPYLEPYPLYDGSPYCEREADVLGALPAQRQGVEQTYIRDGTVYCFRRATVGGGDIYGRRCLPLIIDPADSCELDTEHDWQAVERRWTERATAPRS